MNQRYLSEKREDYGNRKIREHGNSSKFSCKEPLEVVHLVARIQKHFPLRSEGEIRSAIESCCREIASASSNVNDPGIGFG